MATPREAIAKPFDSLILNLCRAYILHGQGILIYGSQIGDIINGLEHIQLVT